MRRSSVFELSIIYVFCIVLRRVPCLIRFALCEFYSNCNGSESCVLTYLLTCSCSLSMQVLCVLFPCFTELDLTFADTRVLNYVDNGVIFYRPAARVF